MNSPARLRIDFVSDVACPWCAIGLAGLQEALARLDGTIHADIHLQPFELNPQLLPEGEDANEHLMHKYGMGEEQLEANRSAIRERAAALGFAFNMRKGSRIYNTFDAHRLLHWAGSENLGHALPLKQALLRAYFSDGENVADREVLARIAGTVGLDADAARRVLESGAAHRRSTRAGAPIPAGRHPFRTRDHHQRRVPHFGRAATGSLRTRIV